METGLACTYKKIYRRRLDFLFLAFSVFVYILLFASMAYAVVDVTLAWDSSPGAEGYRLFYREDGQNYDYSSPDWEGTATTATISGLDESITYHFVARAFNQYGESANSNEATYTGLNQAPSASFTANATSGEAPLTVTFNASGSIDSDGTIDSYSWDFGDGVSGSGLNISHTYTSAGNYTVALTVTDDDGATGSSTRLIQVSSAPIPNQAPRASFTASPTSGDAPLAVAFNGSGSSDTDGSIVSYSWNFGDGSTSTGVSRSHSYNSAGNYTATLTVTDDDGATGSSTRLIQVAEPPVTNLPPNQPVISSPYQGEMETDLLLSVETEPFSDPDGDAHKETQWQIVKAADSSVVLEIVSNENLTKLPVPHAVLDRNTTYNVSVQFLDSHSEPSSWSDPVEFTTHNGTEDYDGDGIPDDSEVDDTVDLNEDGTPDNDQPEVIKSAQSAVAGHKPIGINKVSSSIDSIDLLEPIHPSEILDKKNKPKDFLFGLTAYRLKVNQVGATTKVKVYYAEDISGATGYYIYDTVNGWQDYTQYVTFNPDGRSVTVELQDGGHGDSDGVANGVIVDPGGIADFTGTVGPDPGVGGSCFVATAAFGAHMEPKVSFLREFRDRYLLTNVRGRAFNKLYYKYGPTAADHIKEHSWLKLIVRVLLMPLVGLSYFLVKASVAIKILIASVIVVLVLNYPALRSDLFEIS